MLSKQQTQQQLAAMWNTNPEFQNTCLIKRLNDHQLSVNPKTSVYKLQKYSRLQPALSLGSPSEAGCYIPGFLEDFILLCVCDFWAL